MSEQVKVEHDVDYETAYNAFATAHDMLKDKWETKLIEKGSSGLPELVSHAPMMVIGSALHVGFAKQLIDDSEIQETFMPGGTYVEPMANSLMGHRVFYVDLKGPGR